MRHRLWTNCVVFIAAVTGCAAGVYAQDPDYYVNQAATGANTGLSWTDAFTELSSAFADAGADDVIWVAAGEYEPGNSTFATFQLAPGMQLYGGFQGGETSIDQRNPNPATNGTVIDGEIAVFIPPASIGIDYVHVLVTAPEGDSDFVLDGFTLKRSDNHAIRHHNAGGTYRNLLIEDCESVVFEGAGMRISSADPPAAPSRPTIESCIFRNNRIGNGGAGAGIWCEDSDPFVLGCLFESNRVGDDADSFLGAGSAFYGQRGRPVIRDCTFKDNLLYGGFGGAMYYFTNLPTPEVPDPGSITVLLSQFLDNRIISSDANFQALGYGGGGAFAHVNGVFFNCTFARNRLENEMGTPSLFGRGGGLLALKTGNRLVNSLLVDNRAGFGAGLFIAAGFNGQFAHETEVRGCTITRNIAMTDGGGVYVQTQPTGTQLVSDVTNCIAYDNQDNCGTSCDDGQFAQIWADTFVPGVSVTFSDIENLVEFGFYDDGVLNVNNIGEDPSFVDPDGPNDTPGDDDDDFRLLKCSPAIDRGTSTLFPFDTPDLDDDLDFAELLPDRDLFDRAVDDPATEPNPGAGTQPYLDLGAYEFRPGHVGAMLLGDLNRDMLVNGDDVPLFTRCALGYTPGMPISTWCLPADMNQDGDIDFELKGPDDLDCFVLLCLTFPDIPDCVGGACPEGGQGLLGGELLASAQTGGPGDCNGNGIDDALDMSVAILNSLDCNDNGIIDACDIESGFSADANGNGYPDECDAAAGLSPSDDPVAEYASLDIATVVELEGQFSDWAATRSWGPGAGEPAATGSAQFLLIVDKRRELGLPLLNRWIIELP